MHRRGLILVRLPSLVRLLGVVRLIVILVRVRTGRGILVGRLLPPGRILASTVQVWAGSLVAMVLLTMESSIGTLTRMFMRVAG